MGADCRKGLFCKKYDTRGLDTQEVKTLISITLQKATMFGVFCQMRAGKVPLRKERDLLVKVKAAVLQWAFVTSEKNSGSTGSRCCSQILFKESFIYSWFFSFPILLGQSDRDRAESLSLVRATQ